jgi:hypothetical protein
MSAERRSPDGISLRHIGAGAAVIAAAVAVALLGAWGLIVSFDGTLRVPAVHPAPLPAPVLEQHPLIDRQAYELKQREKLSRYAWIDRDRGVVQIPVDTALTLISKRASPDESSARGKSP